MKAQYLIQKVTEDCVYIVDRCNELGSMSITNDAEAVTAHLYRLYSGKRIIYRDTEGNWDELCHTDGVFTGFAPTRSEVARANAPETFLRWLLPGLWEDTNGAAHCDIPFILQRENIPDTQENRKMVADWLFTSIKERLPDIDIERR